MKVVTAKRNGMVRGNHLEILVPAYDKGICKFIGIPLAEGLKKAEAEKRVIASGRKVYMGLASENYLNIVRATPCFTGTMTAYATSDTPFEKDATVIADLEKAVGTRYFMVHTTEVEKIRYIYPIPEEHLGTVDGILVSEHPNYRPIFDGKDVLFVPAGMKLKNAFVLVEGFPTMMQRFSKFELHDDYHVPTGNVKPETGFHFERAEKGVYPVMLKFRAKLREFLRPRDTFLPFEDRLLGTVYLNNNSGDGGIIVESPVRVTKDRAEVAEPYVTR